MLGCTKSSVVVAVSVITAPADAVTFTVSRVHIVFAGFQTMMLAAAAGLLDCGPPIVPR